LKFLRVQQITIVRLDQVAELQALSNSAHCYAFVTVRRYAPSVTTGRRCWHGCTSAEPLRPNFTRKWFRND